jgi:wyosine [tRNA(Phe)-imidazoG37] synthetase (radical SAM superfamily)
MLKVIRTIFRPHPAYLYIEPYFGCNFSCFFCFYQPDGRLKNMKLDPALFEKLKPVIEGVNHIHITGLGEPFLNPHLLDYLRFIRAKNKSYYINTNGSLIKDSHIEVMTTSRCQLSFSLDAGDEKTYKKVRHLRNWGRIMTTLAKIQAAKKDLGSPFPHLVTQFNINRLNLKSLLKLPALCREMGIEAVRLSWTILPPSYAQYCVFNHQAEAEGIIQSVVKELDTMGVQVKNSAVFDVHEHTCWDLTGFTFIGANGVVASCCNRWVGIGSLLENSFEDIWNGMPHRKIGFGVYNGKPESSCKNCRLTRPINYRTDEENFFRHVDTNEIFLHEKSKKMKPLPSLHGLDRDFHEGVAALFNKNLHKGVQIFSNLQKRFPDFYEIKHNLAVAFAHLGHKEKSLDLQRQIKELPHIES